MEFTSFFSGAILGAFITAIIAELISGYFNIKTKSKEYENSYAKMILEKRLFAYEQINLIINKLIDKFFKQKKVETSFIERKLSDRPD